APARPAIPAPAARSTLRRGSPRLIQYPASFISSLHFPAAAPRGCHTRPVFDRFPRVREWLALRGLPDPARARAVALVLPRTGLQVHAGEIRAYDVAVRWDAQLEQRRPLRDVPELE